MGDRKPTNILEAIYHGVGLTNQNVLTLSENLNDLYDKVVSMQEQLNAVREFFNQPVPEKPTIPGEDGAVTESRESEKIS